MNAFKPSRSVCGQPRPPTPPPPPAHTQPGGRCDSLTWSLKLLPFIFDSVYSLRPCRRHRVYSLRPCRRMSRASTFGAVGWVGSFCLVRWTAFKFVLEALAVDRMPCEPFATWSWIHGLTFVAHVDHNNPGFRCRTSSTVGAFCFQGPSMSPLMSQLAGSRGKNICSAVRTLLHN